MTTGRSGWILASRFRTREPVERRACAGRPAPASNGSALGEAHGTPRRRRRAGPGSPRGRASQLGARARPDRRPRPGPPARRRSPCVPHGGEGKDAERAAAPFRRCRARSAPCALARSRPVMKSPSPVPCPGLLRRKERLEDVLAVRPARSPRPVSGDGDLDFLRDLAGSGSSSREHHRVVWHRDRVGEEVEDHLLKLVALAQDRRQAWARCSQSRVRPGRRRGRGGTARPCREPAH